MKISETHIGPNTRHSERSEESKRTHARGISDATPLGSFAPLRMTEWVDSKSNPEAAP